MASETRDLTKEEQDALRTFAAPAWWFWIGRNARKGRMLGSVLAAQTSSASWSGPPWKQRRRGRFAPYGFSS